MIIREQSRFRLCWDALILVLALLSCVLIPYQLAFVHSTSEVHNGLMFAISLVFIADIGLNFFTTYRRAGSEIKDPGEIRAHYLKGHFAIDLLANAPLGMLFWLAGDPQVAGFSIVLWVRLLALLRMVRFFVILRRWETLSWTHPGYLRVFKYLGVILIFTHCIACLWFGVAYVDGFARNGYIVFRSDYRGHGNSEGEAAGGYASPAYAIDVLNAVAAIKSFPDADPERIGMWGHSMGGGITLRVMVTTSDVKAGVIWAGAVYSYEDFLTYGISDHTYRPPAAPGELKEDEHLRGTRPIFESNGWPDLSHPFWQAVSLTENIEFLTEPLQLHHAVDDPVVDVNYSHGLAGVLLENGKLYEFYTYDGGGHNLISPWFDQAMLRTVKFFEDNL